MAVITLKGREIPLVYTTYEMKQMQEEIAPLDQLNHTICGRNPEDDKDDSRFATPAHLDAIAKAVRIMGNAGLEEAGEDGDLTDKKVMRAMKPTELGEMVDACMSTMYEAMKSEIPEKPEEKQEGPVDETLEKIMKKKEKES